MGPHVRRKRSWSNSAEDTGRKVPSGPALRWRRTWRKRGREDRRKEVGEREEKGEREREGLEVRGMEGRKKMLQVLTALRYPWLHITVHTTVFQIN